MSLTALAVFLVFFLGLALGVIVGPMYALLSYIWIFYNHPASFWWGEGVPDLRYSLIAAVVALCGTLYKGQTPTTSWTASAAAKILILYAAWMWIQTPWAVDIDIHINGAVLWTKYVVLYFLFLRIVTDVKAIKLFLYAHLMGCLMFGWVGFTSEVGGRLETVGGPGVDDANLLAAHLITGVAVGGFFLMSDRGWKRLIALVALPFVLNAIILTQSRGGLLALLLSAPVAWYLSPKGSRYIVLASIVAGGIAFLSLSNQEFWDRIGTMVGSTENPSEETRVGLIGPQFRMFQDHPFGVGHGGNAILSVQYMPPELLSNSGLRSAHNTFMAALVDQGFPGALLLISIYLWAAIELLRLKALDRLDLPSELGILRAIVGTSLFSYFVTGMFLNLIKSESQIWFVALLVATGTLCRNEVSSRRKAS